MPTKQILYISFLMSLGGCENTGPTSPGRDQTPTPIIKVDPPKTLRLDDNKRSTPQDKTSVFSLIGPGSYANDENFNRWNELPRSKGLVHVFANDQNDLKNYKSIKHQVSKEQLANELGKAISAITSRNLIIFLNTHGDPRGNLCYTSKNICDVTEDDLLKALQIYADQGRKTLQHVLVIPLSCYNKKIMDAFLNKIKGLSFSFAISVLSQKFSDQTCGTQSIGESLFESLITPFEELTEAQLDAFINSDTLEKLVDFNNNLILSQSKFAENKLTFEVRNHNVSSPIDLKAFGFDIMLRQEIFMVIKKNTFIDFPHHRSVQSVLKEHLLPDRFHQYIKSLLFILDDDSRQDLIINGDVSTTIDFPGIKQKVGTIFVDLEKK